METIYASIVALFTATTPVQDTTDLAAWAEQNGYFATAACLNEQYVDDKKAACVADLMTNGYFEDAFRLSNEG